MSFVEIAKDGEPIKPVGPLTDTVRDVCDKTAALYESAGSHPPWMGYLVLENDTIVGTCAFRSPPRNGEIEIAYFTFPEFKGRSFATEMARHLIQIVKDTKLRTRIFAFTLPEKTRPTPFCRNWDSISLAKRVTKISSRSGDGSCRRM